MLVHCDVTTMLYVFA